MEYPKTGEEALKVAKALRKKYPEMFSAMREGKKTWGQKKKKTKKKDKSTSRTKSVSSDVQKSGVTYKELSRLKD